MRGHFSLLDRGIIFIDNSVRTLSGHYLRQGRPSPAKGLPEPVLSATDKRRSQGFMRVNHAGEIAAQGLYHGQALAAKLTTVRAQMEAAAKEEGDHLSWCRQRLNELDSPISYLTPVWYAGAAIIGFSAALVGDQWSLGFVAETEAQVTAHLAGHEQRLGANDPKSLCIISQMKTDEMAHAAAARAAGAKALPTMVKTIMQASAKVMTTTAYYV